MENSYILSGEEALKFFGVSEDAGLSEDQVFALREKHGSNGIILRVFYGISGVDMRCASTTGGSPDTAMAACA